jgi:NAD(P)-dependent dehydrogenase (short-subunit alcohol dehydrogenase family)
MDKVLSGHVALVTGGVVGIGRACAVCLAQAGAKVAVNGSRDPAEAKRVLDEIQRCGVDGIYIQTDISQKTQVNQMFTTARDKLGPVDILVNNAGIADPGYQSGWALSEETWDRMMDINLKGVFLCCAAAIPDMIASGWGRIINISSTSGISGGTSGVHYAASKGGVIALTKAYANELASKGITVNTIAPSKIETEMLKHAIKPGHEEKLKAKIPAGRFGKPEEIAEAVLYFARPEAGFTTGQVLVISGGY